METELDDLNEAAQVASEILVTKKPLLPCAIIVCLRYTQAPILLRLRTPANNERGPQHTEHLLADVMQANRRRLSAELVYTCIGNETVLGIDLASSLIAPATKAFSAHYPGVSVTKLERQATRPGVEHALYLRLAPDCRSLRVAKEFEDQLQRALTEPVTGLLSAVTDRGDGLRASIRFSLKPCSARRRRRASRVASVAAGSLRTWLPSLVDEYATRANGTLLERVAVWPFSWFSRAEPPRDVLCKLEDHLFLVTIKLRVIAPKGKEQLAKKRLVSLAAAFAPFTAPGSVVLRSGKKPVRSLLSAAELAALWHPPVAGLQNAQMQSSRVPYLPAPVELPDCSREEGSLPLGCSALGRQKLVGVRASDRLHSLIIGKSGQGKSCFLNVQIDADIACGRGVGLIDPHGDLVDDVLRTIPTSRTNQLVVVDPASPNCPTINPLACPEPSKRALVVENNLAAISKVFELSADTAPRLLHILRITLMAIVGTEYGSYLSILPMLTDKKFRKKIVDRIEDSVLRSFWVDDIGNWSERYEQEAMPAVINKVGQFITHPRLQHLFGDPQGDLDLRTLMDSGKIVLVKLSQGILGESAARFAGSMLMTGFQNAAMTRADLDRSQRTPFYLYADEYATFVNSSFADTLAQARKFGLYLTAAQQNISQVEQRSPVVMDAMFGNLWTLVAFQVAQNDAERLAAELSGGTKPEDLLALPKYHAIVRAAVDGVPSRPFVVKTLPPPTPRKQHACSQTIQKVLARRYRTRNYNR